MNQKMQGVSVVLVRGLVEWCERKHTLCSTWLTKRESLHTALCALPEAAEGFVNYHTAVQICRAHNCNKLAGGCQYADYLHGKLRENKVNLPNVAAVPAPRTEP